jgi:predicted membrane protein
MRFAKLILGEMILLMASVFVFRSLWLMLDEYFSNSNLLFMLIVGVIFTIVGLFVLNHEVKCEMEKNQKVS